MNRRSIETDRAPRAIGPYSQGVLAGGFLFAAMQIALDPETGDLVGAGAPEQTARCLENLKGIVAAAGGTLDSVVKFTVYLRNMDDFARVNDVYSTFFRSSPPARGVVEVSSLPRGALIGIEAIAAID